MVAQSKVESGTISASAGVPRVAAQGAEPAELL